MSMRPQSNQPFCPPTSTRSYRRSVSSEPYKIPKKKLCPRPWTIPGKKLSMEPTPSPIRKEAIVAGRLQLLFPFWQTLTINPNILNLIQGYQIEFSALSAQIQPRITLLARMLPSGQLLWTKFFSASEAGNITSSISAREYISPLFFILKRIDGVRPIFVFKILESSHPFTSRWLSKPP